MLVRSEEQKMSGIVTHHEVLGAVQSLGGVATCPQVMEKLREPFERNATVRGRLWDLHREGKLERSGRGTRNEPYQWSIPSCSEVPMTAPEQRNPAIPGQPKRPERRG